MIKRILVLVILAAILAASGSPATPMATTASVTESSLKVVASTSWVGAFALAAGAEDVSIIAPSTIQHPPDYDPKPSDLEAVSGADYVLYAGFEGFAPRMQEAVGGSSDKLIIVATENSPEAIHNADESGRTQAPDWCQADDGLRKCSYGRRRPARRSHRRAED